jgi:hypothetical protein
MAAMAGDIGGGNPAGGAEVLLQRSAYRIERQQNLRVQRPGPLPAQPEAKPPETVVVVIDGIDETKCVSPDRLLKLLIMSFEKNKQASGSYSYHILDRGGMQLRCPARFGHAVTHIDNTATLRNVAGDQATAKVLLTKKERRLRSEEMCSRRVFVRSTVAGFSLTPEVLVNGIVRANCKPEDVNLVFVFENNPRCGYIEFREANDAQDLIRANTLEVQCPETKCLILLPVRAFSAERPATRGNARPARRDYERNPPVVLRRPPPAPHAQPPPQQQPQKAPGSRFELLMEVDRGAEAQQDSDVNRNEERPQEQDHVAYSQDKAKRRRAVQAVERNDRRPGPAPAGPQGPQSSVWLAKQRERQQAQQNAQQQRPKQNKKAVWGKPPAHAALEANTSLIDVIQELREELRHMREELKTLRAENAQLRHAAAADHDRLAGSRGASRSH